MKTRISYIVSNVNKALAFEWISLHLNKERFDLHFILLNPGDSYLEKFLNENKIPNERITYHGKRDIPKAILKTISALRRNRTQIVHTHLFDANIVGLSAAKVAGIKKRIHTRHHSTYHHLYHPNAVKYDRFINGLSTDIIAISGVVKDLLTGAEKVPASKIHLIHHGFQLDEFTQPSAGKDALSKKYNPGKRSPVVGVIARHTEWKGIQYIIPAFRELLKEYPEALLIMANANGEYRKEIERLLDGVPEGNFIFIPFENDVAGLYKLFDVFIHTPIDPDVEAFGQTYVEALASGVPSVFTISGIAHEFIEHERNALVVPHKNFPGILSAMKRILLEPELRNNLIINGKNDTNNSFGLGKMMLSLELLYDG